MVTLEEVSESLLRKPSESAHDVLTRTASSYKSLHTFDLDKQRSYKQQFSDMYFLRLTKIKPAVDAVASSTWDGTVIGGEAVRRVDRVLDVRQGDLCWVTGTVYIEMPLKPNILEDVSKDKWISKPTLAHKYFNADGEGSQIMLEDDSGRIRLVGDMLSQVNLVTGCIVAVMGTESMNGELEVIDIKVPDLAPQPARWALGTPAKTNRKHKAEDDDVDMSGTPGKGNKLAIVSGLSFTGNDASHALELGLLVEYLLGESLSPTLQEQASQISRLIIAGNSISMKEQKSVIDDGEQAVTEHKKSKKYGYDSSAYNPVPAQLFDDFLADLLPSIPITLLPGATDPANASYPQQPIHSAMFPQARAFGEDPSSKKGGWLDNVTNPFEGEIDGWRVLGTGGQNVDDVFKYIDSDDRLGMMEAMCRWRCCAPTAPDTLWSYPFQDDDPFVLKDCPHLYFVGCQPEFGTRLIHGPGGQSVRLITVPSFVETGEVVLVDMETLQVSKVKIGTA